MEFYIKGNSSPILSAALRCLLEFLQRHSSVPQVTQAFIDLHQTIYSSTLQMDSGKINRSSHSGFVFK